MPGRDAQHAHQGEYPPRQRGFGGALAGRHVVFAHFATYGQQAQDRKANRDVGKHGSEVRKIRAEEKKSYPAWAATEASLSP